jgi:beta-galactosidase
MNHEHGPVAVRHSFDHEWLFGGPLTAPTPTDWPDDDMVAEAAAPDVDDSGFERVSLPHTVAPLSWNAWDPETWEQVWSYRKHFDLPSDATGRIFLDFEAANVTATVTLNGHRLGRHWGGYLPFSVEVTDVVTPSDNVLSVLVDSRFNLNVPPNIPAPMHSEEIDFWQPGGIYGTVTLRAVPLTHIADVAATVRNALDDVTRRVEVTCFIDSVEPIAGARIEVEVQQLDGTVVGSSTSGVTELAAGTSEIRTVVDGLDTVSLWDVDSPTLYRVVTTLSDGEGTVHSHRTRIGFREARFELDGFYLNGRRLYLFGANRHQHFPYAGFAMPARVQRKDAEMLRNDLNCVMVRCSHYPQLSSFLDACDELGLLVWEESPGWQYIGDSEWQQRAREDIAAMVVRDRNRPSVIIWAGRLNETPDHPELYEATERMIKELDDTRATSGTSHGPYQQTPYWQHDVFSYDDYSINILPDGDHQPTLLPPREDLPYLIGETVTSWSSPARLYRRADDAVVQQHQAMDYAYAHNIARGDPRYTGVLALSGFDYQAGHVVNYRGMKTSGMIDTFRVLKPGAAMYRAQIDPHVRIVVEPAFTWDPPGEVQDSPLPLGSRGGPWGPGERAVVFSNCDRLEVSVGGIHRATVFPQTEEFPHLLAAPSIVDLRVPGSSGSELVIDGYLDDKLVATRRYSGDLRTDVLTVSADDSSIRADGVDATRVELAVADEFGNARGRSSATISVQIQGPGVLIGDAVVDLSQTGAVAAVWVRSIGVGETGEITVTAIHPQLGNSSTTVRVE